MINTLLLNAISWARQAGEIQLDNFRHDSIGSEIKSSRADIVTEVDNICEELIINNIKEIYPTHSIIAEESGHILIPDSEYTWIIDPLDGTTNYLSGLPFFSISLAICHCGEVIAGVVYAPRLDEIFHAVKGEGAFLNGHPIKPSANPILADAVVATGFPVDKTTNADNNLENVARIMPRVRGLRRLGSAAIDLCYVAAGFLDGYWELNLHQWDIAAGQLICSEAGARVERLRPDRGISVIAASQPIFESLKSHLK